MGSSHASHQVPSLVHSLIPHSDRQTDRRTDICTCVHSTDQPATPRRRKLVVLLQSRTYYVQWVVATTTSSHSIRGGCPWGTDFPDCFAAATTTSDQRRRRFNGHLSQIPTMIVRPKPRSGGRRPARCLTLRTSLISKGSDRVLGVCWWLGGNQADRRHGLRIKNG